jgi:ABC-type multidrug transport system ATPase subunit
MSLLRNLKVKRGSFELDIPELKLTPGEVTVLYGDSGSGKSTVVGLLTGLVEGEEFFWEWKGENLSDLPVAERRLGVVLQEPGLFPHLTGLENIDFAARARGVPQEKVQEFLREIEPSFRLSEFLHQPVSAMSGGQVQRVAMARSLVAHPHILLWDEPFSALQTEMKESLRNFLKRFVREKELAALLISHDPRDRDFFAPHVVQIHGGRLAPLDH